jgi:hypothetical protein
LSRFPEVTVRRSKSTGRGSARPRRVRTGAALAALTAGLVVAGPASAFAAGPITPFVSCYWTNGDGTYTVSVGYTNNSAATVTVPVGPNNYVTPSPIDRGQPTVFLAGTHSNVWAPTISGQDFSGGANWYVNGVPVDVSTFTACASKPVNVQGSTLTYLTGTAIVAGAGLFVLATPRRRRRLASTTPAAPVAAG